MPLASFLHHLLSSLEIRACSRVTAACVHQDMPSQGLQVLKSHSILQALKEKTRIYVPDAVLLMGVMDELNVLRTGELFLNISPRPGSGMSPVVITGPVIMGRNPCFHPGDIRRLQVRHVYQHVCCASASLISCRSPADAHAGTGTA